jgi:hypothetical protein
MKIMTSKDHPRAFAVELTPTELMQAVNAYVASVGRGGGLPAGEGGANWEMSKVGDGTSTYTQFMIVGTPVESPAYEAEMAAFKAALTA